LPVLRGGGELGEAWARAGVGRNRQHAIDDYQAACRALVDAGWTVPAKLIAEGQSAGASLVAAAVVQHPGGFGGVVLAHPVLDMLGYERDPAARRWRGEFGTVEDDGDRQALAAWSPLRNLTAGVCYPPALILPSELDQSAAPFHGYKYVAKLADVQARQADQLDATWR
jgi:prolyl oligopeptidase